MEIAKGITSDQYNALDLSDYTKPDWDKAFEFLNRRLIDRYIEPADVLEAAEKDKSASEKKYGFTILAIDCFLIETIQSFYEGETDSQHKSQRLFKNFLTQRDNFKEHFKTEAEAGHFYINFRCGILHQAQTFGNTKVWAVGQMVMTQGKYLIVNRERFHQAVKAEKDIYLELLKKRSDIKLLEHFKTKMDFIATA